MKAGCDGHKWAAAHTAHAVLLWLSVSILALFFLELSALVVCLRRAFLRNKLYLLDLIIVSISLGLEIALSQVIGPGLVLGISLTLGILTLSLSQLNEEATCANAGCDDLGRFYRCSCFVARGGYRVLLVLGPD